MWPHYPGNDERCTQKCGKEAATWNLSLRGSMLIEIIEKGILSKCCIEFVFSVPGRERKVGFARKLGDE